MKNFYKVVLAVMLLCGSLTVKAQNRVITGIVRDVDGPLPGVSVLEKGMPSNGISTSVEGTFTLTLRGNSNVLIIRGVGYITKEVNVAGKKNVDITMATDAKGLEDVVVVGYGTQKKIAVTGSVSSVTREEIQQTPSASIQNALTGKLPGFFSQQRSGRPGGDAAAFYVRGVSTFNESQATPLILVDDIEFTYQDFANIDPNEVSSISILKDAATTAPYGVKGANGVILVTTRRGQVGTARINFRTEYGIQTPTHVPELLGAADMAILRNEALKNDAIISGGTYTPEFTDTDIQKYRDQSDPYGHPDIDWYNTLYKKTAPMSKSNFDISGGTEAVRYLVSLGYEKQDGFLRNFRSDDVDNNYSFNRLNFRSNLDIKANRDLSFRVDFSGNNTITNQPQISGINAATILPTDGDNAYSEIYNYEGLTPYVYPIYNPDGSYGFAPASRAPGPNNIVGRIANGGYDRFRQNLMTMNFTAVHRLDFITKGLQVKGTVSISNSNSALRSLTRSISNFPSYYYNPADGSYTPRNTSIYRIDPYSISYEGGRPRRQSTIQFSSNYDRTFKKHDVSVLLLATQSTQLRYVYLNTTTPEDPNKSYQPVTLRGVVSRIKYGFNNKYLIEFDGAYNGSSKFAASHRYGFFPAGSAAWNIGEENFVKEHARFINLLKLRGSYGIVGSDDLGRALNSYEENYKRGGTISLGETNTTYTSIIPDKLANDQVTWEKERKIDIGLDFSFFNGRLSGTVDFFDNRRYDILTSRNTIPSYFGIPNNQLPPVNIGIVSNKGYDIDINYNGKIGKDFGYRFKGVLSYAKNKYVEFDEVPQKYPYQVQTGRSIGEVLGFVWDGYYSVDEAKDPSVPKYIGSTTAQYGAGTTLPGFLKYRDLNGDGVITDDDRGYFGKPNLPTTTLSFGTGFNYKRFSMNLLLQSSLNYDVQIGYNYSVPFKGNLQPIHLKRWTPETAETAEFPALVSNFHGTYMTTASNSSFWAVSGDFLRVKSLELGYQLPELWAKKVGLKGVRVYANGYNLLSWSHVFDRYGIDPETVRGSGGSEYRLPYPQTAIYNLGFNISIK